MPFLAAPLDRARNIVRSLMYRVAVVLDRFSRGKLSPNMITITSFLAHIGIAYLIATRHPIWASGLLIVFGLFDALDGALARVQQRVSNIGMLLDATTDRMKEVLLYMGAAYFFISIEHPYVAIWAVAACGASLCVSYVKAKGETAVAGQDLSASEVNKLFQDGLARFEMRMALFIVGLFTALLPEVMAAVAILATITTLNRLVTISRTLRGA